MVLAVSWKVDSSRDMEILASVRGSSSSPGRRELREKEKDAAEDFLRDRAVYCARANSRPVSLDSQRAVRQNQRAPGTHPKVALNETAHLLIPHNRRITHHPHNPLLKRSLDEPVVFFV